MYTYAQLNRFHHDLRIQVYMYDFMYIDPEIIPVEDHFPATKIFVVNYNKISTPQPVPKHRIGFSYISSEYYELNHNFYDTDLKNNQTTHPTMKFIFTRNCCGH